MAEKQQEDILLSIMKMLDEQNEKTVTRDEILIQLTKEIALIRVEMNERFKKNHSEMNDQFEKIENQINQIMQII